MVQRLIVLVKLAILAKSGNSKIERISRLNQFFKKEPIENVQLKVIENLFLLHLHTLISLSLSELSVS